MKAQHVKVKNLRIDGVCSTTTLSRTTVYNKQNPSSKYFDPDFPASFKIGQRAVAWDASEIEAWVQTKKDARIGN